MEAHLQHKKLALEKDNAAEFMKALDNLLETDCITMDEYLSISIKASEMPGWQKLIIEKATRKWVLCRKGKHLNTGKCPDGIDVMDTGGDNGSDFMIFMNIISQKAPSQICRDGKTKCLDMDRSLAMRLTPKRGVKTPVAAKKKTVNFVKQLKKAKRRVRPKYKKSILTGKAFTQDLLEGNPRNMYNLLRMTKAPFIQLCNEFRAKGLLEDRKYLEVEEKMAMFLYTIGHNCRNRVILYHFQHSGEKVSKYFHEVLTAMKKWSAEVLVPPPNVFDKPAITKRNKCLRECAFKGVVGALDGTLISVIIPVEKQTPYRGRGRGECSQNVLAICDWDMYFLYVVVGWEGTAHDSRVLTEAVRDPSFKFPLPPPGKINCAAIITFSPSIFHLRLVPPIAKEEKFNQAHARLRNVIERAFGVLKVRFPVLSKMPSYSFETQRDIVIACMSIHNFLRRNALDDWLFKDYENETGGSRSGSGNGRKCTSSVWTKNLRDEIASLL
ncbi:uncharacterized protein LOC113346230 [Papaver somniferum]|uniref:uncharacterized protein LOC113346230 n=1 Tax=Papaver somniferum TaxID=3469 RepID=UPI000E703C83|nr:uncharacterized protein LOC113346230 [Papaver somniferum]